MLAALGGFVERGTPIVGSRAGVPRYRLRDEFLVLGLGDAADRLSARAFLFEEFLAAEQRCGRG